MYSKKTWKDTIAEYPNRRILTKTNGTSETVTVARSLGTVNQQGDMFNAQTMNDLENRISNEFTNLTSLANTLPNLIPYPYDSGESYTQNGITYTVQNDGSIVANGTCSTTDNSRFTLVSTLNIPNGEQVTLCGCASGGGNGKYAIYTKTLNNFDYGNGVTFAYDSTISGISIVVYKGQTVNNLVFKPMLVKGNVAPTEFHITNTQVKTLASGSTTLTFNHPLITTSTTDIHTFECFAQKVGVTTDLEPISFTSYTYTDGQITFTFDTCDTDLIVVLRIH